MRFVRAVAGCQTIFHLAAMASVYREVSANQDSAMRGAPPARSTFFKRPRPAGARRMVLASTSAVYGNSPFVSKRETDPTAPLSPYAAAKLSAESYLQAFANTSSIETVILRYFNVYGPRQDPQSEYSAVIPRFVSMILAGDRPIIYGDGEQSRDFVFVEDVATANLLAATVPNVSGGVFNIGRGSSTTLLELLTTLREILGQDIEPIHEPPRLGDVRDSLADITQARTQLMFDPKISIVDGLRKSVDYYRSIVQTA